MVGPKAQKLKTKNWEETLVQDIDKNFLIYKKDKKKIWIYRDFSILYIIFVLGLGTQPLEIELGFLFVIKIQQLSKNY